MMVPSKQLRKVLALLVPSCVLLFMTCETSKLPSFRELRTLFEEGPCKDGPGPYIGISEAMNRKPRLKLIIRGRLGNVMFEWGSTMGVAARNGMEACLVDHRSAKFLGSIFDGPFPVCEDASYCHAWQGGFTYATNLQRTDPEDFSDIALMGYMLSPLNFAPVEQEVVKTLTVKQEHQQTAKEFLAPYLNEDEYIRVGVHVRRGDKANSLYKIPDGTYYSTAMAQVKETLTASGELGNKKIVFVVTTENDDDWMWFQEQVVPPSDEEVVHSGKDIAGDFAVLTQCQHIIVSEGTFTFNVAYFGVEQREGGRVFYSPEYSGEGHVTPVMPHWEVVQMIEADVQ